ncbi:hypothetical protein [Lewinella sp. 4G2]|uniref:hypothetical protein n=1 Tax=Lewinella sp. 4G2 TaxID=1803372 RepID=UPI0007B48CE9|nr:hypothetical protein [Lewinella sp. 4G2]OAV42937.1 hypothetical protein A3850_017090 [Lewinella sp. 4G2]
MSESKHIHTFQELEERKRELELEVEVSKRELAHSLGTSKVNLNDFLLKKVALPIGGAIAGVYLISKLTGGKKNEPTHEYHEKTIVREVPAGDEVAKYHYPVPPPREERRQQAASGYAARQPAYQRPTPERKQKTDGLDVSQKDKSNLVNLATIASVAKIAVPAVKMIIKAVKDHQDKQLARNTDGVPNI